MTKLQFSPSPDCRFPSWPSVSDFSPLCSLWIFFAIQQLTICSFWFRRHVPELGAPFSNLQHMNKSTSFYILLHTLFILHLLAFSFNQTKPYSISPTTAMQPDARPNAEYLQLAHFIIILIINSQNIHFRIKICSCATKSIDRESFFNNLQTLWISHNIYIYISIHPDPNS